MSMVRVLVGTRKGAFILTSDAKRARWEVSGPLFGGWEIYHLQGAPLTRSGCMRRSRAAGSGSRSSVPTMEGRRGRRWGTFVYDGDPGTHQWYDGTPRPEFKRIWHLEPSLAILDTVYAGEDAACSAPPTADKPAGAAGAPQRAGTPLAAGRWWHVPAHHCAGPGVILAHLPRHLGRWHVPSDDGGRHGGRSTRPTVRSIPNPTAEVGHCVHRIAAPVAPARAVYAEGLGRHAQRRRRQSWHEAMASLNSASRSRCTRTSRTPSTWS